MSPDLYAGTPGALEMLAIITAWGCLWAAYVVTRY